jgi:hypothetical protein
MAERWVSIHGRFQPTVVTTDAGFYATPYTALPVSETVIHDGRRFIDRERASVMMDFGGQHPLDAMIEKIKPRGTMRSRSEYPRARIIPPEPPDTMSSPRVGTAAWLVGETNGSGHGIPRDCGIVLRPRARWRS